MNGFDDGKHLSVLDMDLWRLDELEPARITKLRLHLERCTACVQRLAERDEFKQRFRRVMLPHGAPKPRRTFRGKWFNARGVLVFAAGMGALLFAVVPKSPDRKSALPRSEILFGVKGSPTLRVYAKSESGARALSESGRLAASDAIRFVVDPAGARYLLLASVDGDGALNVYFPYGGTESARLPKPGAFAVPGSIVLDAAAGPERVYALLSNEPIPVGRVRAALARLAKRGPETIRKTYALPLSGVEQATFLIEKAEARP